MIEYDNIEEEDDEEEEEALSLRDLPLKENEKESSKMSSQTRKSSSEPPEFFEFFSDFSSDNICSAEDIIFCGKLIPFKDLKTHNNHYSTTQDKRQTSFRRRSESLSGLHSSSMTRSNSINTTKVMMRNSRSLDYLKLERFSSSDKTPPESDTCIYRNSSVGSIGRGDGMVKKAVKPRWYVLMFGVVKPPKEMELKDIKNRQVRRNIMFPPAGADTVKKPPISKGSCQLLRVLSCRDPASVAVATSFYTPPV